MFPEQQPEGFSVNGYVSTVLHQNGSLKYRKNFPCFLLLVLVKARNERTPPDPKHALSILLSVKLEEQRRARN